MWCYPFYSPTHETINSITSHIVPNIEFSSASMNFSKLLLYKTTNNRLCLYLTKFFYLLKFIPLFLLHQQRRQYCIQALCKY